MASRSVPKLTKKFVESYTLPETGYDIVREKATPGFGVKFNTHDRTYFVERKVHGKTKRPRLGRHGEITLDQARKAAKIEYGKLAQGIDPVAVRREQARQAQEQAQDEAAKSITLAQAYEDFLKTRTLAPKSRKDYDRAILVTLGDWRDLPLTSLTGDMVLEHHSKLSDKAPASANLTMRALRAVLNYALERYTLPNGDYVLNRNPVAILSKAKAWKRVPPRTNAIKPYELADWFEAVEQEENRTVRDYLKFVLLTGLRRENAASLTWSQVDIKDRSFTVKPKAHDDLTLPLSDYLVDMLEERRKQTGSPFVFPGEGEKGHLQEPRKALERIHDRKSIRTTVHDLRRSYARYAASLNLPERVIKQLMAHTAKGDVTQDHYIQHDVERLRVPAQSITDYVLTQAGVKQTNNVVPLKALA